MDIMNFPKHIEALSVTHICLIGDDPTVNITPLIDRNIPSHRIIVACTSSKYHDFELLAAIVKARGYLVEQWLLPENNSIDELQLSFMQLFERESHIKDNTWLNVSNGIREQTLTAYEVARTYKLPIFIVEQERDRLCWLYPEEWPALEITDKIKLSEFLKVYDCSVVDQQNKKGINSQLRELGDVWLNQIDTLTLGLKQLNFLASKAKGEKFTSQYPDQTMKHDKALQRILFDLESYQLIELAENSVNFLCEKNRFFANGGWLEEVTYGYVRGLRSELPAIQDDGHSVEISRKIRGKEIHNELDVVALVNNKLHVIECKTKRFNAESSTSTLYKLNSLAERLGGIKARAALVTYYPINEAEWRRAEELDITIICGRQLCQLKSHLRDWFNQS